MMDLQLQFGYGMMDHCRTMVSRWGSGNVILSPRDLTDAQMVKLAKDVQSNLGTVWIDPQFYLPHADHVRLRSHDYWPSNFETGIFWQGQELKKLIDELFLINKKLSSSAIVLPGMLALKVDSDWFIAQEAVIDEAVARNPSVPLVSTVAISDEVGINENQIAELIERAERWNVSTVYLVCQHPRGIYLVDNPNWLANIIDLAAGLKLSGKNVVLGYCNHQMLLSSLAKVQAIASGTWMNVRSFPPEKFVLAEEEMKQRSTWYYCPQSLSEYKIPFLDIAQRMKLLPKMAAPALLDGGYASDLFSGKQPTTSDFTEQLAFRHYLYALRVQAADTEKSTFDESVEYHRGMLDDAESLLQILHGSGIRGQQRDFKEIIDVNRAALELFVSLRGPIMRRQWSRL